MTPYLEVITTTETKSDAERIAKALVRERLAACAQISGPIQSIYWWQGKMESAEEWRCIFKTSQALYSQVEDAVRAEHAYAVPQIVALPIVEGSKDYLNWLERELQPQ
jgi:periplasmic divalent cation tolerance protein